MSTKDYQRVSISYGVISRFEQKSIVEIVISNNHKPKVGKHVPYRYGDRKGTFEVIEIVSTNYVISLVKIRKIH